MRRSWRYASVTLLIVVLLAAVGVIATRAGPVQRLERLPGGIISGPSVEDVSPTSAVVVLKTAAPAFCQVNYGLTTRYGQMSRMSMAGAMTDHRILLPGLAPDTVYHFRLTAVDAQARLYQSDNLTFRTLAAPAGAGRPRGENVAALGAGASIAGVSSNYGGEGITSTFGANNAIDGDPATEWSTNGDGDAAWIEIELAGAFHITAIGFWTRTMGASAEIREFEVIADGRTTLGPFTLPGAAGMHYFPVDVTARRLRFNVLKSTGGNTGAVELAAIAGS